MATADIDLFLFFLKEGVDPNVCDKVSNVVVMIVAVCNRCHLLRVDNLQLGKHPLFYATNCGRQDLAGLLIEHGADVDLVTKVS